MGPLPEIGTLLIQSLGSLYLLLVVLRFLLQLVRADFYNPVSQFVVKATNPPLLPLRRLIPGLYGIDMAAVVLALLVQFAIIQLTALVLGAGLLNPVNVLAWGVLGILSLTSNIFFWGLLLMVIVSWVAPQSDNPALLLVRQLMEPVIAPFQRLIPPMGGLDLSVIFAFLALQIVDILLRYIAAAAGVVPALVAGI
jgi:YggT family protein